MCAFSSVRFRGDDSEESERLLFHLAEENVVWVDLPLPPDPENLRVVEFAGNSALSGSSLPIPPFCR